MLLSIRICLEEELVTFSLAQPFQQIEEVSIGGQLETECK